MKKKLTMTIELTPEQLDLLKRLGADNQMGFDDWACEHSCTEDAEDENMQQLTNLGLAESILGDQFFITNLGKKFLKNDYNNTLKR